jgi:DNA processing protein
LITVQFGLEEGREIFAVPGQVDSLKSSGTHWLVQQGATLAVSADDVLEQLSLTSNAILPEQVVEDDSRLRLNPEAAALLTLIEPYPQPRELLLRRSSLPPARVSEMLLQLELEGLVELVPGDAIRRVTNPQ